MLSQIKNLGRKGFFYLFSANIFIALTGFLSNFFIAGIVDSEDIGRLKILQSILQVALVFGSVGVNASILRLCSSGDYSKVEQSKLFYTGFIFTLIALTSVYFLLFSLSIFGHISPDENINNYMLFFALILFPMGLNNYFSAYLQSQKSFKKISTIQIKSKSFGLAIIMLMTWYFGIYGFIIGTLCAFITTFCLFFLSIKSILIEGYQNTKRLISGWVLHSYYARNSLLANFFSQLIVVADIIFINFLVNDRWVIGQYAFCLTIVIILDLCITTLQQTLIPYFSLGEKKHKDIHLLFTRYQRFMYVGVIVLPFFIYSLSVLAVPFFYGTKFDLSLELLPFTLLCWSIKSLSTLKYIAFFGGDRVHITSYIAMINFTVTLMFLWGGYSMAGFFGIILSKNIAFVISYLLIGFAYYFLFIRKT